MAKKNKNTTKKMFLPGPAGPERKHYCFDHDIVMTPFKLFGKKSIMFQCKEGCRLKKGVTTLK